MNQVVLVGIRDVIQRIMSPDERFGATSGRSQYQQTEEQARSVIDIKNIYSKATWDAHIRVGDGKHGINVRWDW
jgi:hypothetical protein